MHFCPGRSWRQPFVAAFLTGGIVSAAAQEMRILGQVTQGEVDDITRGALMGVPEAAAAAPPADPSGIAMPLPEVARLPDEEAALSGDANAMYCLAGRYERGDGVAQNTAIALSW